MSVQHRRLALRRSEQLILFGIEHDAGYRFPTAGYALLRRDAYGVMRDAVEIIDRAVERIDDQRTSASLRPLTPSSPRTQ